MSPDYQTLYRFEELISSTLESLFNASNLKPKSAVDNPQLISARPRVEAFVHPGPRFDNHYVLDADGNRRENGWSGGFILTAITENNFPIHSSYLAAIRNLAATLDWRDLTITPTDLTFTSSNPFVPLAYHEISQIRTAGTASTLHAEQGEYHSQLHYEFIFAIRADAWPGGLTTA